MKRHLLNVLTAVSLLLCVAVVALWVRSGWVADELHWTRADDVGPAHYRWYQYVYSSHGGLLFCRDAEVYDRASITTQEAAAPTGTWTWRGWQRREAFYYPASPFGRDLKSKTWFYFAWQTWPATVLREMIVPHWALALPAAVLPAVWTVRRLRERRRRRRAGFCPSCGYDLRATPGRCPECGTIAAAPPPT
jgi:hypothetical protein